MIPYGERDFMQMGNSLGWDFGLYIYRYGTVFLTGDFFRKKFGALKGTVA